MSSVIEKALKELVEELEWLRYFYESADFGESHDNCVNLIKGDYTRDTGKEAPNGY